MLPRQPFQLTRNLNRYREIAQVLAKHGFGGLAALIGLPTRFRIPRPWRHRQEEEAAHRLTTPERFRRVLEELGPTFIKLGQILSTRPDITPPSYRAELEKLQDKVPPSPWHGIKERIETELKLPIEDIFEWVDVEPLAAASLAQVHAARLKDGSEVVVKVLRPNIEKTIETDLAIIHDLAGFLQTRLPLGKVYDLPVIAEDFAHTMNIEMDYRHDGNHADRFRENFQHEEYLHVPKIYWEFSTRRVLMMERVSGLRIDDPVALTEAGYDPHKIALQAAHFIIKEIFEDGFFHADPHPGNMWIMEGGVIGLMDFGMVGWITVHDRFNLMRLYAAAIEMNEERLVDALVSIGVTTGEFNRTVLRWDVTRLLRKYHGLPLKDIRASTIIDEVMPIAFKHHLKLPSEYWLLSRTVVIMEGVGLQLDPEFDIFAASEPYIKKLRWRFFSPENWGPPILKGIGDWAEFAMKSPEYSLEILEQLQKGNLQLKLNLVDLDSTMDRVDKAASRLSVSIVIAALILGLAFLIPSVSTGASTWVQILVIGGFIGAALLGVRLLWSIFKSGV